MVETGTVCVVTTVPLGVVWVICVVWVVPGGTAMTAALGGGGGGAETTWEAGSVAQPANRPRAPQMARRGFSARARSFGRAVSGGSGLVFIPVCGPWSEQWVRAWRGAGSGVFNYWQRREGVLFRESLSESMMVRLKILSSGHRDRPCCDDLHTAVADAASCARKAFSVALFFSLVSKVLVMPG